MARFLFLVCLILCTSVVSMAQKLYGGSFERQPSQQLNGQPFSYRFACTFYADVAGRDALPATLKFKIIRKRDNVLIKEFVGVKQPDPVKKTIYNDCVSQGATPQIDYFAVAYVYEAIVTRAEYGDAEGYYVVNDAPAVPRAKSNNVQSSKVVLYHWFSPEYLTEKLDNADQGLAIAGVEGTSAFICRNEGKSIRLQLDIFPSVKIFNPNTLDITARSGVPLTEGMPFSEIAWQAGYSSKNPDGGDFIINDSKPKFDNNSETTFFDTWTVPTQNGNYYLAFVMEQQRNGLKLAESSVEIYTEVNDCKKISNVSLAITEPGSNKVATSMFCKDKSIQLNGVTPQKDLQYQWYKNQEIIVGATSPQLKVSETGRYFLKTKLEGACGESNTATVNALSINCQNVKSPLILGNNLHDLTNTTVPSNDGFINQHAFRAIYYTSLSEVAKMPSAIRATIYKKRDNQKVDEILLERNISAEVTSLLDRLCDKGVDSIQQVMYDVSYQFKSEIYNDPQGYFINTEPVCCRADADNLSRNGSSIVTSMEINPANQVKANSTIQRGHTVDLFIPFTIKACAGQPVRVSLYAGNRENITAQFGGFTEILEGDNNNISTRTMTWGPGYTADNFTGNLKKLTVEPRRNGQMVIVGVPEKPGVYVYRMRIDGLMNGKIYSSVFEEFRLEVDDCSPAPKPQIFVSKVGKPKEAAPNEMCQDSLVQLNLRNFRSWGKFQWYFGKNVLNNANDSVLVVTKNQSGAYFCTVKMARQCPEIIETNPQSIVFLPKPVINITANSPAICEGQSLALTARSTTDIKSYQWTYEDNTQKSATQSVLTASQAGAYKVTIIDTKGCSSTSLPYQLTVNILPKAGIKVPQDYFCQGQPLTLTAQTDATSPKYQWIYENNVEANATNNLFTIQKTGQFVVKITDMNGCVGTSIPQLIVSKPLPQATIQAARNIFCAGKSLQLTASKTDGYRYEWSLNGANITDKTNILTVSESGSYIVKITNILNCSANSQPFTVQKVANPTVSILAPLNRVCQGVVLNLVATGQNLKSFQWLKDNQVIAGDSAIYSVKESGKYSVKVSDNNDCVATSPSFGVEIVLPIKIQLDSIPDFCGTAFEPVRLYASPPGGVFSGKGVDNNSFSPLVAGIGQHPIVYTVKGNLECLSGSVNQTVKVKAAPSLSLGPEKEIFRGMSVKLNADMGQGYTYQWTPPTWINDVKSAKPIVDPDNTTFYKVLAISPDDCRTQDSIKIIVSQRIFVPDTFTPNGDGHNDTWRIVGIEAYPDIVVTIYSRWGNVVFYGKGSNQVPFDGTMHGEVLPSGTYTYVIQAKPDGHIDRGAVIISR